MKTKNVLVTLAVFVVVVLVVVAASMLREMRPSEDAQKMFPKLTEGAIAKIVVTSKEGTATLVRKGDVWAVSGAVQTPAAHAGLAAIADSAKVKADSAALLSAAGTEEDYPVDSASITSALEKLTGMKKDELVSNKPEKQAMFEVDTAKGTIVKVWDTKGAPAGTFLIGKNSAAGWSSNYVRMDGSNNVYSVGGNVKYAFFADPKRWRDRTITKFSISTARKITLVKKGGPTIVIERATDSAGANGWSVMSPEKCKAAPDQVDEILNAMTRLTCTDWETDKALTDSSMGFVQPQLIATVTLDGGSERTLVVGNSIDKQNAFWVRTPAAKDVTFRVSNFTIERLDKNMDKLRMKEAGAQASAQPPQPSPPPPPAPVKPAAKAPVKLTKKAKS